MGSASDLDYTLRTEDSKRHTLRWGGVLEALWKETRFYYVAQAGPELAVILLPQPLSAGIPA